MVRPRAALLRLVRQLDDLPGGSVVTVVAPIGADQDELIRLWDRHGSLRPRRLQPGAPGESLRDGLAGAVATITAVSPEQVDDYETLLESLTPHRFLLVIDSAAIAAYGSDLGDYLNRIPPRSLAVLIDNKAPDLPIRPRDGGRTIRITRHQLAVTHADFEQAPFSEWPRWTREIVLDYAGGWPFALRTVSELLSQESREIDSLLAKDALVKACAPIVLATFAGREPAVAATAQHLADCGPLRTSDFDHVGRADLLGALNEFIDSPLPMIAVREGRWSVSPLLRDLLAATPLVPEDERRDFAMSVADLRVREGDYAAATDLLSNLPDRQTLKQFTARWAFRSSMLGHPEIGLTLLGRLPREDVFGNPDLLMAYAVADLTSVNLPAVDHWSELLKFHEDPIAYRWTSSDARSRQCLRQVAELDPPGDALAQAMSGPTGWVGLAHVATAARLAAQGDFVRSEGILDALGHLKDKSLVVWGWRRALLIDLHLLAGRVDEAVAIYRAEAPVLEESRFADQRVTFFLDAALAKAAALAGDHAEAGRLAARSLDKTMDVRIGVQTVRLHALVLVAETAVTVGMPALARAAVEHATQLLGSSHIVAPRLENDLIRLRELGRSEGPALTAAQKRVLAHLAGPYPVPHIAKLTFVSPSTVRTHIRAIYKALGVTSRTEAVDRAITLGLID